MKLPALLLLPVLLSSCGLLQMPARLINQVIAPLTDAELPDDAVPTVGLAVRVSHPAPAKENIDIPLRTIIPDN